MNLFNYYIHTLIKWSHLQSKLFLHTKYKEHYIISIKKKNKNHRNLLSKRRRMERRFTLNKIRQIVLNIV